tara:strand:- start:197 stop:445 length:249 start_codon:yes stop_codon:yes gene_type:complete
LVLHNNGFTGIDKPNTYSREFKMTKQKQMTEKELDQVSGGAGWWADGIRGKGRDVGPIGHINSIVNPIGKPLSATDRDHKDW